MSAYPQIKDLDRRMQRGEVRLVEAVEEMRRLGVFSLNRAQLCTATERTESEVDNPQAPAEPNKKQRTRRIAR